MGLKPSYLEYIRECIQATMGSLEGKQMLELGNQHILAKTDVIPEKTGKEYYEHRGVIHTSIDLNGLDGAIKMDLSKPIKMPNWLEHFDIVTNAGTSEHVSPKEGQYECFMNVHNCLRVGGIAVHLIPDRDELMNKGCWKNHCRYYYCQEFVEMLAEKNNYKIISLKTLDGLLCFCVQKIRSAPFMKNREKFLRYIEEKRLSSRAQLRGLLSKFLNQIISKRAPMIQRLVMSLWNFLMLARMKNREDITIERKDF